MSEHGRLSVQQRAKTVLFYAESKSVTVTQRKFRAVFHTRWAPARNTILRLHTKFEEEGSVKEEKRPRVPAARSPENIAALRVAMQRSPRKSTRQAAREIRLSRRSVQRILHSDLKLFPYKMTVLHKLTDLHRRKRLQYALWTEDKDEVLFNTWFSDEAYFHLNGSVNKQNVRFWATQQPETVHERSRYGEKVSVWIALSSHGLIGPFFFDQTVNAVRYKQMLENYFVPQLLATELPFETQWFMQDGATPHTANNVLNFLKTTLRDRVMSHRYPQQNNGGGFFWPPLSPDLNPCDFFLWGYLKEKLFATRPGNMMEMRARIVQLCSEIHEDLCRKVVRNMRTRLEEVVRRNGGHIEHVIQ